MELIIEDGVLRKCKMEEGETEVIIPDGVTEIGDWAFKDCIGLQSLIIPDSVKKINSYAFCGCNGLQSVTIPRSVTAIGESAFSLCSNLTSVIIPDSVTKIGDWAFSCCTRLESVTIPDSVTKIGKKAFSYCESLQSVTIPDGVTEIDSEAFSSCTSLESVTIPDSVTKIGDWAFSCCTRLESVTISDSVTEIGGGTFSNCTSLKSFIIAGDAQIISKDCFGHEVPKKLLPEIMKLITHMNDSAFKQYILTKKTWNSLSDADRFSLFVTRQGKSLQKSYLDVVSNAQVTYLGTRMLKMFDGTPSVTECNAVAALLLLFGVSIDDELIKQLFNSLKNAKNGKKAVSSISKDASLLNRCSGKSEKVSEIEKIAVELIKADELTTKQVGNKFTDLYSSISLPVITDTAGEAVPTYILQRYIYGGSFRKMSWTEYVQERNII